MKKEKSFYFILFILFTTICFPMLQQGIMCNDELLSRIWSQKSLFNFFKVTIYNENILKGRILGTLGSLKFLSYISDNIYLFRFIDILFIITAIVLLGILVYRLFGNANFAYFVMIITLVCYPITFEFATPNAFVIVCIQPLICVELSIIFYLNYLKNSKRKDLVISLLLFLWAMFLYEFNITYVLLYTAIFYIKNRETEGAVKKAILKTIPYYITSIIYLLMYIGQGVVFPSNYSGNQLGISSLKSVFVIVKNLFLSSLPGYYSFFNEKYKYLFEYYNQGKMNLGNIISLRIIISIFALCYLIWIIVVPKKDKKIDLKKDLLVILVAFLYGFLPALPNGVSTMYQGNVTDSSFTSLPVSVFLYFSNMIMISYIGWMIFRYFGNDFLKICIIFLVVFVVGNTQVRNDVFAKEQFSNYERIVAIEELFELDYWQQFGDYKIIQAPSLFETKNSLAVEDTHWTEYMSLQGKNIFVMKEYDYPHMYLEMQNDNGFYLYWDDNNFYITKKAYSQYVALQNVDGEIDLFEIGKVVYQQKEYKIYQIDKNSAP